MALGKQLNWFQRWMDRKLKMPFSHDMRSISKDPACKDPMCGPDGIRKDVRMSYR